MGEDEDVEMGKRSSAASSTDLEQAMPATTAVSMDVGISERPKNSPAWMAAMGAGHLNRLLVSNPSSPKSRFAPKDPADQKRSSFNSSASGSKPSSPKTPSSTQDIHRKDSEKYVLFRTRSSKIEKQLSRLREEEIQQQQQQQQQLDPGDHPEQQQQSSKPIHHEDHSAQVPAGRYFDALQGPELEQLKESEEALLPLDQRWPFLLRFPISSFGVALGLGSQSILWKNLSTVPAMRFLHAPEIINTVLWFLAAIALAGIFTTYLFKAIFYLEAVRREYYHPVRANFFFAPWIAAMFLALGIPPSAGVTLHPWIWCCLMAPILALELKIYGQWLSGGQRRLSKVANPCTHLSVVGNFVGALLGATVGWIDGGIFFWAIGLAHYLVLFVTLYQRLPTNEALPKELHPVFFLFIAAPSAASLAWEKITGDFGIVSRIAFFIALFLFSSLVVRINFFRGFRFSLAWWAYTFPMTAISIASIHYCQEVSTPVTQALATILSSVSSATVALLFVATMCHWLVWKTLFPNDLAIAITNRRRKRKRHSHGSEEDFSTSSGNGSSKSRDATSTSTDWSCAILPSVEMSTSSCFGTKTKVID
uniref:SLOW ANION CHANNEL-ASSOCIATED 1a variant 2 n=1 Tax=Selaginella moellendorffii TaxID=88036 RepID=A0A1I9WAA5_SELML|nr:SLOW ANION CHANNEL-ASSOCIATED 1a variant 2 [Selaginella moellendorffii]